MQTAPPELNAAVARHFHDMHGYDLVGVGAAYLGFMRATPPDPAAIDAIAKDFCALYNATDKTRQSLAAKVTQAITGRTYLWLRYVE